MDDYLTVFDNRSNGVPNFQSAQSRYDRVHVPLKDAQWILCDFCGSLVNRILFDSHVIQHQLIDLTYTLNHFELAEEQKVQKLSRRIQRKEKRQQRKNHSLVGLDVEEETDSSFSSASSSDDDSSASDGSSDSTSGEDEQLDNDGFSLPGCSNAIVAHSQPRKRKRVVERKAMPVKKKEHKPVEENKKKKQQKREKKEQGEEEGKKRATAMGKKRANSGRGGATVSFAVNGVKTEATNGEKQPSGRYIVGTGPDNNDDANDQLFLDVVKMESCGTVPTWEEETALCPSEKPSVHAQRRDVAHQTAVAGSIGQPEGDNNRRMGETEEQRLAAANKERHKRNREANRKRRLRAWMEAELMRHHLGPNHHRVYVDNSAAMDAYFDRRTGRVLLDRLRSPPPQLRRSRRGVMTTGKEELQCLL